MRAEKTLAADAPAGEMVALAVVVSGLAAELGSAGWQVAWLVAVAVVAGLRRWGRGLAATMRPPGVPQGPYGLGPQEPGGP